MMMIGLEMKVMTLVLMSKDGVHLKEMLLNCFSEVMRLLEIQSDLSQIHHERRRELLEEYLDMVLRNPQ